MDSQISGIIRRDFPEEFRDFIVDALSGTYMRSYEDIARPAGGFISQRTPELDEYDLQVLRKARRDNGMRALLEACNKFGFPYQLKSLRCNGQKLVVAQLGQILLIAEPIDYLTDRPEHAKYKEELAASHFSIRQLELDLGDAFVQRIDTRNTILVVLQHGMRSGTFSRRDAAIAMVRLVVPDVTFASVLWSANALNDELAMALDWRDIGTTESPKQEDKVTVTLKAGVVQGDS